MVNYVNDMNELDDTFMKKVLDFVVFKRERFKYGYRHIINFMARCLCIRPKNITKYSEKEQFLYFKGDKKLSQELDIVNLVRSIRQLRLMAQVLLRPRERVLLKFQRKNVIETTSSSSDSDHHSYDTFKLLNSKKGLVKLQQIVKINRVLEQFKDRPLEVVDKNLIKGIFRRRPTKKQQNEQPSRGLSHIASLN